MVNYTYLRQMLLDTVIGTSTYVNNTDYDASGRVDVRDLGLSGGNPVIRMDYTYFDWATVNGQGRLQRMTNGSIANPTSLMDLRYTYDANGNVLTIQDYKDKSGSTPQTQTFTYDNIDRLWTAKTEYGTYGKYTLQTYSYDSTTGNLISKAGVNYAYGDSNHKHAVTAIGSDSFSYDANGNQTTRNVGGNSYTLSYDAENRLVSVSGAATATFVYDGDGNRVKGTVGTTTTTYIGNYFEWISSTSNMKQYYYDGSVRVAVRQGTNPGTINFILGDHLGSTAITTNSSGVRNAEIRYYPWGTSRYSYSLPMTNFRFTGQRFESIIGLYFYGARWYDPSAGRFISADTVIPDPGNSQAWDRYAYTLNNPLRYTDPSGHNTYCDSQYADPEECSGMRKKIKSVDDYILFENRGPLHETDDYRYFGDYRGKDPNKNINRWHVSIDAYDDLGTNVYPVLPGVVTKVGWEASLGNYIVIKHETEYGTAYSVYGHLGTKGGNGNLVKEDNVVDKNTPIGTLGNSTTVVGNGTYENACTKGCMTPHLHFEIRYETNVNADEEIMKMRWWAFDSNWIYDFFDLGQIYGYVDNAAENDPILP